MNLEPPLKSSGTICRESIPYYYDITTRSYGLETLDQQSK